MGVTVESIKAGNGIQPTRGSQVFVHYTGWLTTGMKFDSSRDRGGPFQFTLGAGRVIKGWDEGISQMSIGERARLTCYPDYGNGEHLHVIFDVELLGFHKAKD